MTTSKGEIRPETKRKFSPSWIESASIDDGLNLRLVSGSYIANGPGKVFDEITLFVHGTKVFLEIEARHFCRHRQWRTQISRNTI